MKRLRSLFAASLSSMRVRLALWNVGVIAVALIVLGGLLRQRAQANLLAELDKQLARECRPIQNRWKDIPHAFSDDPFSHHPPFPDTLLAPPGPSGDGGIGGGGGHLSPPGGPPPPGGIDSRSIPMVPVSRLDAMRARAVSLVSRWHRRASSQDAADNTPPPVRLLDKEGLNVFPGAPNQPFDPAAFRVALRAGAPATYSTVPAASADGGPFRVYTIPLHEDDGRTSAILQSREPLTPVYQEVARLTRTLLALSPLALVLAGVGGLFLTDRALRPVRAVTRAAAGTQAADLSARLEVRGNDEFSELAGTFNAMLERLEGAFSRLESAYEQQRRFVADASHELKTPLTVIKANTSLALADKNLAAADYREALEAVDAAADRTSRIVQDLFLLARSDAGQIPVNSQPVTIASILDAVAAEGSLLYPKGAPVTVQADSALTLCADPHLLHRLFSNLVGNALRHTPPSGRVALIARAEPGAIVVEVSDTGEGIPEEHLPHVTERFYRVDAARARTSPLGGGTGLGLPIARAIAEAHGGTLTVTSARGRGTTVRVSLAAGSAASAAH